MVIIYEIRVQITRTKNRKLTKKRLNSNKLQVSVNIAAIGASVYLTL